MDFIIKGEFPNIAYYIPDGKNLQARIPFRCRIESPSGQAFSVNLNGLIDTGIGATISTPVKLEYKSGAKVLLNDILYSVGAIQPYIPDSMAQGLVKQKINVEYIIALQ